MALSQILRSLNLPDPISGIRNIQSKFTVSNAFRMAVSKLKTNPNQATERKTAKQVESRINQGGDIILSDSRNFTITAPIKDSIINIYNPRRVIMGAGGDGDPTSRGEKKEEELEARRRGLGGIFPPFMNKGTKEKITIGKLKDAAGSPLKTALNIGGTILDFLGAGAGLTIIARQLSRIPIIRNLIPSRFRTPRTTPRTTTPRTTTPRTTTPRTTTPRTTTPRPDVIARIGPEGVIDAADDAARLARTAPRRSFSLLRMIKTVGSKALGPLGIAADLMVLQAEQQAAKLQALNESLGKQIGMRSIEQAMIDINGAFHGRFSGAYHRYAHQQILRLLSQNSEVMQIEEDIERFKQDAKNTPDSEMRRLKLNAVKGAEIRLEDTKKRLTESIPPDLRLLNPANVTGTASVVSSANNDYNEILEYHKNRFGDSDVIPKITDEQMDFLRKSRSLPGQKVDPELLKGIDPLFQIRNMLDTGKSTPPDTTPIPTNSSMIAGGGSFAPNRNTPIINNITNNNTVTETPIDPRPYSGRATAHGYDPSFRSQDGRATRYH